MLEQGSLEFWELWKLWNSLEIVEFIGKYRCIWRLTIVVYVQPTFFGAHVIGNQTGNILLVRTVQRSLYVSSKAIL